MSYTKQEILSHLKELEVALLSGKYLQGRGALKKGKEGEEPSFCCLGVASDVSNVGRWAENPIDDSYEYITKVDGEEYGDAALLPVGVDEYYGFPRFSKNILFVKRRGMKNSATELNDNETDSFPKIAKLIREQYITPLEEELSHG